VEHGDEKVRKSCSAFDNQRITGVCGAGSGVTGLNWIRRLDPASPATASARSHPDTFLTSGRPEHVQC
jgi:hypothetical protein